MRAMVLRGKSLQVDDIPAPVPGEGQVLARVRACGICGSDLHYARFAEDLRSDGHSERGLLSNADTVSGVVMGHEFVAQVVEAGPGVSGWAAGDRVASVPLIVTGDPGMRHTIGYSTEYPGAYGEYVVMSAALLLRVPESLPDHIAALTEPCAVALHAVREAGLPPASDVLVMGAGPIGLLTALWLKAEGHSVTISDPAPARRKLALSLGFETVVDPADGGAAVAVGPPAGFVFECVGVPGTLQQAMEIVAPRSRVIVVGVCMQEDRIRPMLAINKHLTLQFVLGYSPQEFAESLDALATGAIPGDPIVTRTVTLDELPAAFRELGDPRDCKVVLKP